MTPEDVEREARLLYDECPTPKPTWDQLGEVTRQVWRGYVLSGLRAALW